MRLSGKWIGVAIGAILNASCATQDEHPETFPDNTLVSLDNPAFADLTRSEQIQALSACFQNANPIQETLKTQNQKLDFVATSLSGNTRYIEDGMRTRYYTPGHDGTVVKITTDSTFGDTNSPVTAYTAWGCTFTPEQ